MCGIAGFADFDRKIAENGQTVGSEMALSLAHRGPDAQGVWTGEHAVLAHRRLAVIDLEGGVQPMSRRFGGHDYTLVYNGELYNTPELRDDLTRKGYTFSTTSDTEVLLYCYIEYGEDCPALLNGIFAFTIYDSKRDRLFACRDRFGVKPFFYTVKDGVFVFASELKALFRYPGLTPELDGDGWCEVLGLGPARSPGCGVFKGVKELIGGHFIVLSKNDGLRERKYWSLKSLPHYDTPARTVLRVRELLLDSISRQLVSDVPLCTFLSGGLDSSIITAVAAQDYRQRGLPPLETYSFDYTDNEVYFKPSSFQPDDDRHWIKRMAEAFAINQTTLVCDIPSLVSLLDEAAYAKDLPGMADVDSSLLFFCRQVRNRHIVALSGECADEVFGGYPWFHSEQAFSTPAFPWSPDLGVREGIFKKSFTDKIGMRDYVNSRYSEWIASTPRLEGENKNESRRREIGWLNLNWFMSTLLDRKDRMSMASGLEVRVPYCDHRLVEYVWNIPWEIKSAGGVRKSVLREAARGILPEDVLFRPKSPYPKTHNPLYEQLVKDRLRGIMDDKSSPLLGVADKAGVEALLGGVSDYGKPFFGQLMAAPQLMAYLIQLNGWMKRFGLGV
ncbi:MAG: asparagine synthase (glutamine-hydrolyzing) [Eubacteriales bacterium]